MSETLSNLSTEGGGTEITRFNALRHGVLSRYTVLPWEDADEYYALVTAFVAEHVPQGPTEEHLVEELAGILWRKRRLRLAEAAAHRRGLSRALETHRNTVITALVHLDTSAQSECVVDAIRATASDTEDDIREMQVNAPYSIKMATEIGRDIEPTTYFSGCFPLTPSAQKSRLRSFPAHCYKPLDQ